MTEHAITYPFRKHCLATAIGLLLANPSYALQALSDDSLSNTTGEGVALVLDDFKMVFQQPNDLSTGSSYTRGLENPSQYDTGFIRIIPTGENYVQLAESAYHTVYNNTYNQSVLKGKAEHKYNETYRSTYEQTYTNQYSTLYQEYTKNIKADVDAKKETFTFDVREGFFNNETLKNYYNQRLADYSNGTWGWKDGWLYTDGEGLAKDGTTAYSLSNIGTDQKKAKEYAITNTYEMLDLLYGRRSAEANNDLLNSDFYKGLGNFTRADQVGSQVDTLIQAEIIKETASADIRAKYNASQLAEDTAKSAVAEIYAQIIQSAEQAAEIAASGSPVQSLRTKADVFIYGLALSKSDNSLSSRYSNQGFNWGSADNPWLFRAGTEKVKQFKNIEKDVGYLALEAPLATTTPTESDNNIKLGFWTDIFSRQLNSSAEVDPSTGAPKSGLDKEHRLRTQFVANGLSLNGSQMRLFQTLDSDNPNHHQTLGMASLLRLNTNDNPANLSFTDSNLDSKGIRISTAAKSDTLDGTAVTPAIDGSLAPVFHDTEGLYLYSPNINLVLGNMYQPFVVGSEGNNIVLEVTRIPNVPEIYNKIYQNYEDGKGGYLGSTAFTGSTCNVVSCGTPLKANVNDSAAMYQGRNATHSSIAIGTVERLPNNMLRAKDHTDATGVVFKGVDGSTKNLGSVAIDGVLIQHLKFKTTGL
ncbi:MULTISPECIES: hypothetical protein [unclassified Acinetobacter]|uniref:hypothetical protein n=1 Tax=unclassified Acinetobacter TaxID=196816 RepID=UPI0015D0F514|nr:MULTISPECIES: hypothetical protein [unclassified Acinetobacter]